MKPPMSRAGGGGGGAGAGVRRSAMRRGAAAAVAAGALCLLAALLLLPKLGRVLDMHVDRSGGGGSGGGSGGGNLGSRNGAAHMAPVPLPPARGKCSSGISKDLLQTYARNNTVMITFCDAGMWKLFGSTWLMNLQAAGIDYWVLAVADEKAASLVEAAGVSQCFVAHDVEVDDLDADFKWGSVTWKLHTWQKVLTVRHVHQFKFNVLQSDLDVVWFRDPLSYFLQQYTAADYMVSMDPITTRNPIGDPGPEFGVTVSHYMNTGVYFLRATDGGTALIDKWYSIRKKQQARGFHDQDGLYKFLTEEDREQVDFVGRFNVVENATVKLAHTFTVVVNGTVKLAQLPATQFQNGYSHCVNKVHTAHSLQPYEAHFVWVWGNNNGKMHRMREAMYFADPAEYYVQGGQGAHINVPTQTGDGATGAGPSFQLTDTPESEATGRAGFVSVDLPHIETPEGFNEWRDVKEDTEKMVSHHLTHVAAQLSEVYHAFVLAHLLNRTLVLPRVKCWCIQNWFENPLCRLPGELHTQFPLDCPADFLFDMNKLYSVEVQGHRVPIREYSFLDNPRRPVDVPLTVQAVPGALGATYHEGQDRVEVPPGMDDEALLAMLADELPHYRRVHFASPPTQLLGGIRSLKKALAFREVLSKLPVEWCCRPDVVVKAHPELPLRHRLVMEPRMGS